MKDEKLINIAKNSARNAYAPYSNYKVGAALQTKNGKIFTGCNVENASYGLTMCAERTAIFKAVSEGEKEFEKMVIFADSGKMPYPCGACRQVISEFSKDMKIIVVNNDNIYETNNAKLLPKQF